MAALSGVLESLITNSGLCENELSKKMNITPATLNKIKTGIISNPTLQTLNNIAQYFGITIDQLTGKSPLDRFFSSNLHCVPFINSADIFNTQVSELNFDNHIFWKRIELNNELKNRPLFATKLESAAMYPLLDNKTICIIDKDETIKNNALVMIKMHNHDEIIVRRILIDGHFKVLKAINPLFSNIDLSPEDLIIGTIIATFHDFNSQ